MSHAEEAAHDSPSSKAHPAGTRNAAGVLRAPGGAPPDLPFLWDDRTLASGLNFTLTTDLGDLHISGEIPGVGGYVQVSAGSSELSVGKASIRVMDLDTLERSKRAAGRAKDLLDLAEIAEIRRRSSG
jgi:hypothetical protein